MIPSGSQTVGPFFNFALTVNAALGVISGEGERIRLELRVVDGAGAPANTDAMLELWQADSQGRYEGFQGFARLETNADGVCEFDTLRPGRVPDASGGLQAPHINVIVFARGLLRHLHTRVYFAGEASNAEDAVLALVPPDRRGTLLAQPVAEQPGKWRLEIRLQGDDETVFFDI